MRSIYVVCVLSFAFCLTTLIGGKVNAKWIPEQASDKVRLRIFIHYPKDHRDHHRPGHDKGDPGGEVAPPCTSSCDEIEIPSGNFGLTEWYLPDGETYYYVNERSVPSTVGVSNALDAIDNAFYTWTSARNTKLFIHNGNTGIKAAKRDGRNIIAWQGISGSAIGVTYIWYYPSTGQLVEVDTLFNKNLKWTYTPYSTDCAGDPCSFDVQNIGTHEFGHWVGLDDLYDDIDEDLTMYGYGDTAELKKDTLGIGDIVGATIVGP